jgi:hypothetical protein
LGKVMHDRDDDITHEPLPRRWVDLIHFLDEQERKIDEDRTHASTTDPDAKLYRKSSNVAAKLCFIGHVSNGTEPVTRIGVEELTIP